MKLRLWDPFYPARQLPGFWDEESNLFDWDDTELDMYEENDKFIIKLKAPGFDEKNVDITIDDNSVTITGKTEKEEEEEDKKKKYYRKEIRTQSFTRTVNLPRKVNADQVDAQFKNGILTVSLPKAEEAKPKKIEIKPSKQ